MEHQLGMREVFTGGKTGANFFIRLCQITARFRYYPVETKRNKSFLRCNLSTVETFG